MPRRGLAFVLACCVLAIAAGATFARASTTAPKALSGTITVWDWQYQSPTVGAALKVVDQQFQDRHPGVTIKHVAQPVANYNQLVQAAFAARSGPDALMLFSGRAGVLFYKDALEPLTSRITPTLRSSLQGWELMSDDYNPKKAVFAVPYNVNGNVFYFNRKLFRQAGLDPNRPPKTYRELVAAARKLKAAGIVPFGGGNKEGFLSSWWFTMLWPGIATPAQSLEFARGTIKWTDPRVYITVQRYISLYRAGFFDPGYASTPLFPDAVSNFANGKQAMSIGLTGGDASYVQYNPKIGFRNVGVFMAPGFGTKKPNYIPVGTGLGWAIPRHSQNKTLAWEYLKFLVSKQAEDVLLKVGGMLPTNKLVEPPGDLAPQGRAIIKLLKTRTTMRSMNALWAPPVLAEYQRQMQLVLAKQKSIQAALTDIQAVQDKL